ncbi:helix-turn-helix domain-containing protein [Pseudogracilibacillus auburnensis]|uniref:Cytoskeletal protein RodZ n=1 Tax=Pseudogracilibacillus auburnensis TaxID=1494959 RepID=A0A2V3W8U7_9BACI|nr:helix-turn-helix domain-containing protein [Pseudogracilibacillus auburnensis]MBO1003120.1 helix-turn-helix domain-containing protein [Pseudogracilibacillus auburnensis]PXW88675.1 cytoskeletal protein RodZ [Pseudogracilibacillus auburnensis]
MEIGEILREAREANNLSLDDIQEMTKIQKRYLVAIEQNDFHALPGRFYARAFMKEYAQAVGLDASELLSGFDEESIQTEEEESVQYTRLERTKRPRTAKSSSIFSLLPSVIVIILVIGIFFVAWTLYQKTLNGNNGIMEEPQENDEIIRNVDENEEGDQADTNDEDKGTDEADEEEEQKDEDDASGFSVVEVGEGNSPLSTLDFHYTGEQVEVAFEVSERTYIQFTGDSGAVFYEGEIDTGTETFDVSAEEKIYFNIGNTPGLKVTINGVELEYPVNANERIHQKMWVNLIQD